MKYLSLICLAVLAGCASSQQVKVPSGETAYEVKCGNAVKGKCIEEAEKLCPNGYVQLDRSANRYDDTTKVGNLGALEIKADTTTIMLIQCKK